MVPSARVNPPKRHLGIESRFNRCDFTHRSTLMTFATLHWVQILDTRNFLHIASIDSKGVHAYSRRSSASCPLGCTIKGGNMSFTTMRSLAVDLCQIWANMGALDRAESFWTSPDAHIAEAWLFSRKRTKVKRHQ